jgi:hypothetical protein
VPRLLLQPLPGSGQELEHPGFLDRQLGLPVREGGVDKLGLRENTYETHAGRGLVAAEARGWMVVSVKDD